MEANSIWYVPSRKKSNDYQIRNKICNDKITVTGVGEEMVIKQVEIKRKQNETRKECDVKDKLESESRPKSSKKKKLNSDWVNITLLIIVTLELAFRSGWVIHLSVFFFKRLKILLYFLPFEKTF